MESLAALLVSVGFAVAGGITIWKLHGIGSLLAIGIVLLAVGLCGAVAALMGAGLGVILGGAGTVVVLLGGFWVLGHASG